MLQTLGTRVGILSLSAVLSFALPLQASAQSSPVAAAAAPTSQGLATPSESAAGIGPMASNAAVGSSANVLLVSQFAADGAASAVPGSPANVSSNAAGTTLPTRGTGTISKDDPSSDAVARFLADKGLLGSVALQVRDKAADMASDLVISAMDFLGVRYKSGGQSRDSGFDCSGFTRHVFERSIGMILPRRASEQANMPGLLRVSENELKPGDLVFFNTLRHTFSHVGIYVGDNKFIHSPRAGGQVRIEDMGQSYWQKRFDGARRVPRLSKQQADLAQH